MSTLYAYDAAYSSQEMVDEAARKKAVAFNYYLVGDHAESSTKPSVAHAAGMGSILTYELQPGQLVGATVAQGAEIGRVILAALQDVGAPEGQGIAVYPSVDVEVSIASIADCDAAFEGLRTVLSGPYSLRVYGEGALIDHLHRHQLIDGPGWLSASTSYPGWVESDPRVCLVQEVGSNIADTDRNVVTNVDALGAWWPKHSPYSNTDPFTRQMELIMSWYKTKAEFEDAITGLVEQAIEKKAPLHKFNLGPDGHHHELEKFLEGVPGYKTLGQRGVQ